MNTCDPFQLAIEKWLHGALPQEEDAPLRVHLSSCRMCRQFTQQSKEVEQMLATRATQVKTVDPAQLLARIQKKLFPVGCFL